MIRTGADAVDKLFPSRESGRTVTAAQAVPRRPSCAARRRAGELPKRKGSAKIAPETS